MTGKKENKKYSSYSFDCRDEPAMHNMQNISKIKYAGILFRILLLTQPF